MDLLPLLGQLGKEKAPFKGTGEFSKMGWFEETDTNPKLVFLNFVFTVNLYPN
jgi:hypothetical protein